MSLKANNIMIGKEVIPCLQLKGRAEIPRRFRTRTLKKYTSSNNFKLLERDRDFLHHLAFVEIADVNDIAQYFYSESNTHRGLNRLETLAKHGLLSLIDVDLGQGKIYRACTIATSRAFRLINGRQSRRHYFDSTRDLMISKVYFKMGMPASLTYRDNFDHLVKYLFMTRREPEAIYVDNENNIVAINTVHKDLSELQIQERQETWSDLKQIWVFKKGAKHTDKKFAKEVKYFLCE